ncbi:MAG: S8 family serine peptidase [Thermacetogeniaceae bacterium]
MQRLRVFWSVILCLALLATMLAPIPALAATATTNIKSPFAYAPGGAQRGPETQAAQYVPGQIIIKYKNHAPAQDTLPVAAKLRKIKDLGATGAQLVSVPANQLEDTLTSLKASGAVEYATPNYLLHPAGGLSDSTLVSREWGLDNTGQLIPDVVSGTLIAGQPGVDIDLPDQSNGHGPQQTILVGLVDTGVDINHPDLKDSIWVNPKPGQYGYDGDLHGWNFIDNNGQVFDSANPIMDSHGTHIAGIIAAKTRNSVGVVGAAPKVKIVVLKFMTAYGGTLDDAILAIDYASKVGVKVINASWGDFFPQTPDGQLNPDLQPLADAIQQSHILFVAASGNNYDPGGDNLDTLPAQQGLQFYPAAFKFPNVISVAAVNNRGKLCALDTDGFNADFGVNTVDIAAPGSDIVSTFTMDPSWGGSVDAYTYNARTVCWGFGLQDIDGQSNRDDLLRRELLFLQPKRHLDDGHNDPGVLLVDDDNLQAGYPNCNQYWTKALKDLGIHYKTISVATAVYGPTLSEMTPFKVIIWQTGRDGDSNPLLTTTDENNLSAYVQQGGSLLLSGERAIDEDPVWSSQLFQVMPLQLGASLPFYNFCGLPGSNYDGFRAIADGADFGSPPALFDLFVPANQDTAQGGLTPRYAFDNGTSMSAAFVSAVGALLYSKQPQLLAERARKIMITSAKHLRDLSGKVASGGIVDASAALKSVR